MSKSKSLFVSLLAAIIVLTSGSTRYVHASDPLFESNRFTQMEGQRELIQFNGETEGLILASQNDDLALYVHPESLAIKVRNLTTGYVFSSTQDALEDHQLNESWRHFVNSALTIDFVQEGGSLSRESLTTHHSEIDLRLHDDGFDAHVVFGASGIEMTLEVMLVGADVVVSVREESVIEPEGVQLVTMQIYPFFGATKEADVPGYMFIPDGAGALIRFEEGQIPMGNPFRAMVYGDDFGFGSRGSSYLNAFNVSLPVFGMVHGVDENGFLAIIESGDLYAEIVAHTAGLFTEFNWLTTVFHYRYFYQQPTTRDEGRGLSVEMLQETRNSFDVSVRFSMLSESSANYVGMALAYQAFLVERGVLESLTEPTPAMRLEFFGAEMQEGLLFNQIVTMTHITDLPYFASRLNDQNITDLLFVYRGWARGGMSNSFPARSRFESNLGSRNEVIDVIHQLSEKEIPIYFQTDYTRNDRSQNRFFGGMRGAEQINTRSVLGGVLIPEEASNQVEQDVARFRRYGMQNMALEHTASILYTTFNRGLEATRRENLNHLNTIVASLSGSGEHGRIAMYNPNAYAWHLASHYFNIPLTSTGYLFATDTVPFVHIVLSGHMTYYASPLNFSANAKQDILRMVDYGVRPSFLLTSEPAHLLGRTSSSYINTSEFDLWEEAVAEVYETMRPVIGATTGAHITSREILAPGVVQVGYSNGVFILINYTSDIFEIDGITIPAEGLEVRHP